MIYLIAAMSMIIDHIGLLFFPDVELFFVIGRLSFPLFAWGIAKGVLLTSNFKMYVLRLLILGIISQLPYSLLFDNGHLNICFTLLAGLLFIKVIKEDISLWLKIPVAIALLLISIILPLEYGIYGVLTILIFHLVGNKGFNVFLLQGGLTLAAIIIYRYNPLQLLSVIASLILMFFPEDDINISKTIKYSFYPGHIIVLLIITNYIPNVVGG